VAGVILVLSFWQPAYAVLEHSHRLDNGAAVAAEAARLRREVPGIVGRAVASNDLLYPSMYVCHFASARYYGQVREEPEAARADLSANHVAYFLYWGTPADQPGGLPGYFPGAVLVFSEPTWALRVYRLPEAG
jgi:hypothetical protein